MTNIAAQISDAWRFGLYRLLRKAPIDAASNFGAMLAKAVVRTTRRHVIAGARANLRRLRPDASEADIEKWVDRFLDNIGRLMAEFAIIDRIMAEGRTELTVPDETIEIARRGPLVAIMLHTGNWEVFAPILKAYGQEVATIIDPPASAAERRIANETRERLGLELLTPDVVGLRRAFEILRNSGMVSVFGDEARTGQTMGPLFGRPPHSRGNLAVAARLARRANAHIIVAHCVRTTGCRFKLYSSAPFRLPEGGDDLLADVAFLNARIEPIVLEHLEQWYFLDDEIAMIGQQK